MLRIMARAIVFNGTNFELVKKEVPKPRAGHVVVRITIRPLLYVDVLLHHQVFQALGKPIVPGYEGFGIVHSVLLITHFCTKLWKWHELFEDVDVYEVHGYGLHDW